MSKSVAKNALYNAIRTVSYMVFPLVTYPYVTRTLLAEHLGKVDFVTSVVSYFVLLAGLGIANYATREGAAKRSDRTELSEFASKVFSINFASTVLSYLLLIVLFALWPKIQGYGTLLAIQSFTIIGTTLGVEWVYTINEDFAFITIRTILVQLLSAVLLFLLVKQSSDYLIYAAIIVFSNVGANIFNFLYARKYVDLHLTFRFDVLHYLLPMLVLFGNTIAVTIYVNTDVTLLGIFKTDYDVGIYSVAVRIYTIMKQLLNSIVTVAIPRLSLYCLNNKKEEYDSMLRSVAHGLTITVYPMLCMLFLMADYVVFIIGGEDFMGSAIPLRILCFAAMPSVFATFATYAMLLPHRDEHLVLRSTLAGATVNLVLNLVVIPFWGYVGAALTTSVAELTVLVCALKFSSKEVDLKSLLRHLLSPLATAGLCLVLMPLAFIAINAWLGFSVAGFFVSGVSLLGTYVAILLLRHDSYALAIIKPLLSKSPSHKSKS